MVVRKVSTSGIISTIAGNGTSGYSGEGGPANAAEIGTPSGLAIDNTGNPPLIDVAQSVVSVPSPPNPFSPANRAEVLAAAA